MKARLIIFTVCGPVCEHLAKQLVMLRNSFFPDLALIRWQSIFVKVQGSNQEPELYCLTTNSPLAPVKKKYMEDEMWEGE